MRILITYSVYWVLVSIKYQRLIFNKYLEVAQHLLSYSGQEDKQICSYLKTWMKILWLIYEDLEKTRTDKVIYIWFTLTYIGSFFLAGTYL